jgi:hypothetical protein
LFEVIFLFHRIGKGVRLVGGGVVFERGDFGRAGVLEPFGEERRFGFGFVD